MIVAGLCNQMYFFSTAYTLSREWNEELELDVCIDGCLEWVYLLDEFNLPTYKKILYPTRYNIGKGYHKMPMQLQQKVTIIDEKYFEKDGEYLTIPKEKFLKQYGKRNIYLKGTFLARQMFTKYLPELRQIFTLKEPSQFVNTFELANRNSIPIGVHIRRKGFSVLGDDNTMDFFKAAIVYMRRLFPYARFYIFSDEIDYIKEHIGAAKDIFYVDAMNGFRGDIEEFICLTKCHHYILTRRSTYGRMAEILNDRENKISVLYGENTWNDSEERFHFLSDEQIEDLVQQYDYKKISHDWDIDKILQKPNTEKTKKMLEIGLDSEKITPNDRRKIIYCKAQLCAENGDFKQAVHLCDLLEDQYKEDRVEFHEFYGKVLCCCKREREALVEYIGAAAKSGNAKGILKEPQYAKYKILAESNRKHYIIVQYAKYSSQYLSEMQIIGLILGRMGNEVSFVFKKREPDCIKDNQNNLVMKKWEENVDNKYFALQLNKGFTSGRFSYGYPCYDYDELAYDANVQIQKIAKKYPDKESIIITRDPLVMMTNRPLKKVFVDFSEPFDEAYLKEFLKDAEIEKMYERADIIVTSDQGRVFQNQQIIYSDESLLEQIQFDVDKTVQYNNLTLYTEEYLDMTLKIALAVNKVED